MKDTPHLSIRMPIADRSRVEVIALIDEERRLVATVRTGTGSAKITFEPSIPALPAALLAEQIERALALLSD
jgi:hypothetical protein